MKKVSVLLLIVGVFMALLNGCKTDVSSLKTSTDTNDTQYEVSSQEHISQSALEYRQSLYTVLSIPNLTEGYNGPIEYMWLNNNELIFLCSNLVDDINLAVLPYDFFTYNIESKQCVQIFQGDFRVGSKKGAKIMQDGQICVYSAGELLFLKNNNLEGHKPFSYNDFSPNIIEISPDGKQMAYNNSLYQTVVSPIDNIQKQTKIFDKVSDMLWMPDGKHIVQVLDETGINIYNFETQKTNFVPVESDILWFLFSYDNEHVILYDYGAGIEGHTSHVYKIDIITGEKALIYESDILSNITFGEGAVYDEKRIAPESITDYSAFILKKDLQTNEFFQVSPVFEQIYSMKASPDGKQIFAEVKQDGESKYVILQQQ